MSTERILASTGKQLLVRLGPGKGHRYGIVQTQCTTYALCMMWLYMICTIGQYIPSTENGNYFCISVDFQAEKHVMLIIIPAYLQALKDLKTNTNSTTRLMFSKIEPNSWYVQSRSGIRHRSERAGLQAVSAKSALQKTCKVPLGLDARQESGILNEVHCQKFFYTRFRLFCMGCCGTCSCSQTLYPGNNLSTIQHGAGPFLLSHLTPERDNRR